MEINIGKIILDEEVCIGDLELNVVKETPELEDLIVIPSAEEQNFKSEKYGYNNVKVKAIETEKLNILPNKEEQVKEGLFSKVTVAGSENLLPENIKKDVEIFGVTGIAETGNAEMLAKLPDNMSYRDIRSFLIKIDSIDLSNYTNIANFFQNCQHLTELPQMDTSHITNMSNAFLRCESLTSIPEMDTSNVTNISSAFKECKSLISIPPMDTKKVTDMSAMFHYCYALETIPELNAQSVTKIYDVVMACRQLKNFGGFANLGKAYTQEKENYSYYVLNLKYTKLTYESLINIINKLYDLNLAYDVENGGVLYAQSLIMESSLLSKLTEEEIAIATAKGWNVS